MKTDEIPTSFDALAHEHNLSAAARDLCRRFFKLGLAIGKRQAGALAELRQSPERDAVDVAQ